MWQRSASHRSCVSRILSHLLHPFFLEGEKEFQKWHAIGPSNHSRSAIAIASAIDHCITQTQSVVSSLIVQKDATQ